MIHQPKPRNDGNPMTRRYFAISFALFIIGILFYGIYNELIIIRLPFRGKPTPLEQSLSQRKNLKLIYWNGDSFATDEKELIFSENTVKTLTELTTSWLNLLETEELLPKKVTVQSVMIDASGHEAFISFDRNPLTKEQATRDKLLWIEGLLRTIKQSGLPITSVRFLVYAKPLNDTHLDFSHAWPISGYSNQ